MTAHRRFKRTFLLIFEFDNQCRRFKFEVFEFSPVMKNIKFPFLFVLVLFLYCIPSINYAQDASEGEVAKDLKTQYNEMLESSETFTDYKVIKKSTLYQYSKAVGDSLQENRDEINALKIESAENKAKINQLSSKITELEEQLATSEELRESLTFLGINMSKSTYHSIVWTLIGGLAIFGAFAYVSFTRSNSVTTTTKKDFDKLQTEFEQHKVRSHEKQIKIARELQTERNAVEELKTKLKAKTPGKA